MSLESTLYLLGYLGGAEPFRKSLTDLHAALHPNWSVDELLCHPCIAMDFCDSVRKLAGNQLLSDAFILRALLSTRKQRNEVAS